LLRLVQVPIARPTTVDGLAPAVTFEGFCRPGPLPADARVALSRLDKAMKEESSYLTRA
jgi:hypothetical protein